MAVRVERFGAQGTGFAAGVDDAVRSFGEGAGGGRRQEDPHGVGAFLGVVEHDGFVDLLLGDREELYDDGLGLGVPAESHGADAELLLDGHVERFGVEGVRRRVFRHVGAEAALHLLEQRADALGEDLDLLLFQGDADQPALL